MTEARVPGGYIGRDEDTQNVCMSKLGSNWISTLVDGVIAGEEGRNWKIRFPILDTQRLFVVSKSGVTKSMNPQQASGTRVSQSRSGPPSLLGSTSQSSSSPNVTFGLSTQNSHSSFNNTSQLSANPRIDRSNGDDDDDDDDDDQYVVESEDSEDFDDDEEEEIELESEVDDELETETLENENIGSDESLLNVHEVLWSTFENNSNFEDPRASDPPLAPTLNWSAVGKRQNDTHTFLDYFLAFFPGGRYLDDIIHYSNQSLTKSGRMKTNIKEFFRVIAILIGFGHYIGFSRSELFGCCAKGNTVFGNLTPLPDFSKIMSESQFNTIISNLRFSDQDSSSSDSWKYFRKNGRLLISRGWNEMSLFVEGMKDARKKFVSPSSHITIDEGMIKWKGKANTAPQGLPHQQKVMRKPERIGAKVLMLVDATTKILLNMEFVNSREFSAASDSRDFDECNNKSTAAVQRLCDPWKHSNRTVYGDSAFASVLTAVRLQREKGLYFMGPVKTATRHFPKKYFKSYRFPSQPRRCHSTFVSTNVEDTKLLAVAWKDFKLKCFVASCGTNQLGQPHSRYEHPPASQIPPDEISTSSQRVLVQVPRDAISAEYFKYSNAVDCHNRTRQEDIALERRFATRRWMVRVFSSLVGMCIVDAYNAHKYFSNRKVKLTSFTIQLQAELMEYDSVSTSPVNDNDAVHVLRGLTSFNNSLPTEKQWKETNPKKRCNDCLKRKRMGLEPSVVASPEKGAKRGSMYCVLCTERNANGRPMSRSYAHALCTSCQSNHVALYGSVSVDVP